MTRMQDKIVYDLFCIHYETILSCILVMLLPRRNVYRTNHKQSCPASLSCYYLGVMDTEQIINNLVLKIVYDLFCMHYAEVIT
jgi:hypothetical protein